MSFSTSPNHAEFPEVPTFADLPDAAANQNDIQIVASSSGVWGLNRKKSGMYRSNGTNWVHVGAADIPYITDAEKTSRSETSPRRMGPKDVGDIAKGTCEDFYGWKIIQNTQDFDLLIDDGRYFMADGLESSTNGPPRNEGNDRVQVYVHRLTGDTFLTQEVWVMDADGATTHNKKYTRCLQLNSNGTINQKTNWEGLIKESEIQAERERITALEVDSTELLDSTDSYNRQLENKVIDSITEPWLKFQGYHEVNNVPSGSTDPVAEMTITHIPPSTGYFLIMVVAQMDRGVNDYVEWNDLRQWTLEWSGSASGSLYKELDVNPVKFTGYGSYDGAWIFKIPRSSFDADPRRIGMRCGRYVPDKDYRHGYAVWSVDKYDTSISHFHTGGRTRGDTQVDTAKLQTDRAYVLDVAITSNGSATQIWSDGASSTISQNIESSWNFYVRSGRKLDKRGEAYPVGIQATNGQSASQRCAWCSAVLMPEVI